jgi:hypothetical protein
MIDGAAILDLRCGVLPDVLESEPGTEPVSDGTVAGIADRGVEYYPFQARPQSKALLAFSTLSRLGAFGVTVISNRVWRGPSPGRGGELTSKRNR